MEALTQTIPPNIQSKHHIFDLQFHPQQTVLASALVSGDISIYNYSNAGNKKLLRLRYHDESCRCLSFSHDGQYLFSGGVDYSVCVIDINGNLIHKYDTVHEEAVNAIKFLDDNIFVSGDDAGVVKVWDMRVASEDPLHEWDEHEEAVTCFAMNDDQTSLYSTGLDGRLCVYDLRASKYLEKSECQEEDLVSVEVMKYGKKIVCGSQEGAIYIFNKDRYEDCSDRMLGHPASIDGLIKINEDMVFTCCEDGLVRVANIHPNKITSVISDFDNFSNTDAGALTSMALSSDSSMIATSSFDQTIRFYDVTKVTGCGAGEDCEDVQTNPRVKTNLEDIGGDDDDDDDSSDMSQGEQGANDEDSEDWGSDSDGEENKSQKPSKEYNSSNLKMSERMIASKKRENFFGDL